MSNIENDKVFPVLNGEKTTQSSPMSFENVIRHTALSVFRDNIVEPVAALFQDRNVARNECLRVSTPLKADAYDSIYT